MQGRQAESLRLQDHHHAGGWHINAHLNHRGADEHVGFTSNKSLHGDGALRCTLLPVNDADTAMWQALAQQFRLGLNSRCATGVEIVIKGGPLLRLAA